MHNLQLQGVSPQQLANMAAGLAEAGDTEMSARLYRLALKSVSGEARRRLQMRLGIVEAGKKMTQPMRHILRELEQNALDVFVGHGLATWNKTLPFFEDDRFVELADKHSHLLPMTNWHWNLQTVLWAVQRAKQLDGEFMELGVFKGHTTLFCADYVGFADWPKRWYLYDTFEGIPDEQVDPGWEDVSRRVYTGLFSFEEVRDRFSPFPNIEVIKGRVPDVLAQTCPDKIAFLHMDLNSSTAEVQALDAVYDRLVSGAMVVFDDYGWSVARAQHDAENAWFAQRGERILPLPTGQGLFIKT